MSSTREDLRVGVWAAVAVSFAFAVTMLGTTLPTPLYPALAAKYDFGELLTTVLFAVYPLGVTAALLILGRWSDQLGRKPMLEVGLLFSACSAVVFILGGSLGWLFVARLLSGFSAGIFTGTATATIVDFLGDQARSGADLVAAAANMGGLGLGPLIAGTLAAWASYPLTLPFVVQLLLVVAAAGCVWAVPEPVQRESPFRLQVQRIRIPREIRAVFVRAAIAGFAGFAVLGVFAAVSPAFLGEVLNESSPAVTGVVVASVFAASVVGQFASARLETSRALIVGCVGLIIGMAMVGASLPVGSLALLMVGGLVAGLGQGMSFRAGLGSVTSASPAEQRAEIASAFFVALYVGIAIPVVGVGAAATAFGLVTAGVLFAMLVGLLAGLVLVLLLRGS